MKRVGHKGADLIAPGNTLASFDAALAAGVDMVEFDVLPEHRDGSGRLVLAHDYSAADRSEALTLEQGLAHFAADAYAGVELDVDLKLAGYEERVVDALRAHGLAERTLISTMERSSLRTVRALAPEIRLGWSVPRLRRNPLTHPVTRYPAMALGLGVRRILPARAASSTCGPSTTPSRSGNSRRWAPTPSSRTTRGSSHERRDHRRRAGPVGLAARPSRLSWPDDD